MILVSGATGLLGSHITVQLLQDGQTVRAMYRDESRKEIIARLMDQYQIENKSELLKNLQWHKADILNVLDIEDAMKDCNQVIHCAALVSFRKKDFGRLFQVNRVGTANMVNIALENEVDHFIHISSTAAIGSDSHFQDEIRRESNGWNANEKVSGYSLSKHSAEKEVWRGIEEGLNAVIVNPSVMFGAGNWDESSLTIFRTISNGMKFYTRGANAFVSVKDVALAVRLLLKEKVVRERYLVAGHNSTFLNLFQLIAEAVTVKPPSILAGPILTKIAWRLSTLFAFFKGKASTLTKESARSSQRTTRYSSQKFCDRFPEFQFTSLKNTISETVKGRMMD